MKHTIQLEGYGLRLRPVAVDDAGFIIQLRGHPQARRTVGATAPDVAAQQRWIETYYERDGDYYFIIETISGGVVGTVGIYDAKAGTGQWGRWIIIPEMQFAAVSAAILAHRVAFEIIGLTTLVGSVVSTNKKVLSFHKRFGAEFTHVEPKSRMIDGEWVDLVWVRVQRSNWPTIFNRLKPLAEAVVRVLTPRDAVVPPTA